MFLAAVAIFQAGPTMCLKIHRYRRRVRSNVINALLPTVASGIAR